MTYDHLLAQGERLIEILEPKPEGETDYSETEADLWPGDDIPF